MSDTILPNAVEVLLCRKDSTISIIAKDDTSGDEVEQTLTQEQAWQLVTDLNAALLNLKPQPKPNNNRRRTRSKAKQQTDPEQLDRGYGAQVLEEQRKLAEERAHGNGHRRHQTNLNSNSVDSKRVLKVSHPESHLVTMDVRNDLGVQEIKRVVEKHIPTIIKHMPTLLDAIVTRPSAR